MSVRRLSVTFLLWFFGVSCSQSERARDADPFAKLRGAYLGQDPPGLTPQIFGPGVISTENDEAGMVVSPAGDEIIFWTVEPVEGGGSPKTTIYITRQQNGSWTSPEAAPFSGDYQDMYPALHPDGSRLFFQSNRPIDSAESEFEYNIWYVDREGEGWGEPKPIGRPINGPNHTGGASATLDGTLYYTLMDMEGGDSKLYRSEFVNGIYQEPVRLPDRVNAFHQTTDSYVDPEDRYLVFTAFERQGHESNPGDLYVAFRGEDGSWSEAELLGPTMNSEDQFGSVTISSDGKYMFFIRITDQPEGSNKMGWDLYWVSATVVRETIEPH